MMVIMGYKQGIFYGDTKSVPPFSFAKLAFITNITLGIIMIGSISYI